MGLWVSVVAYVKVQSLVFQLLLRLTSAASDVAADRTAADSATILQTWQIQTASWWLQLNMNHKQKKDWAFVAGAAMRNPRDRRSGLHLPPQFHDHEQAAPATTTGESQICPLCRAFWALGKDPGSGRPFHMRHSVLYAELIARLLNPESKKRAFSLIAKCSCVVTRTLNTIIICISECFTMLIPTILHKSSRKVDNENITLNLIVKLKHQ